MNAGERYCSHYRSLAKRQEAIKRKNNGLRCYKYQVPEDDSGCGHCDTFPEIMRFKICFRLRFKWRLLNFLKGE
jgi:hypothetical protein